MCRLFGLMANQTVQIRWSLFEASPKAVASSAKYPDGWGIGGFMETMPLINKSPLKLKGAAAVEPVIEMMTSRCVVSQVRKATVSGATFTNTHPFSNGEWIFAHHGTIRKALLEKIRLEASAYRPEGRTDSEVFFSWLIHHIRDNRAPEAGIRKATAGLVGDGGYQAINFILARHDALYAFCHAREDADQYRLYYTKQKGLDFDRFSGESLMRVTHQANPDEQTVVIASEPLTSGEIWYPIEGGELVRVDQQLEMKKWKI